MDILYSHLLAAIANSNVPQYRLVWFDGKQWRQQQVTQRVTPLVYEGTKMIPIARPRLVINEKEGSARWLIFTEMKNRAVKSSMAVTDNVESGKWMFSDLTDFSVEAWEPSHDTELWKSRRQLHLFVQKNGTRRRRKNLVEQEPTSVYVLEKIKCNGTIKLNNMKRYYLTALLGLYCQWLIPRLPLRNLKRFRVIDKVNAYWQQNNPKHGRSFLG